jgi:hypothetical protein
MIEGKPLVLLQVNCRSVYNKTFDFWNLNDTYIRDVIGTESRFSEEGINAEVSRTNYTTSKIDGHSRGDGVFICVKNNTTLAELCFDELYEIIVIDLKDRDPQKWKS